MLPPPVEKKRDRLAERVMAMQDLIDAQRVRISDLEGYHRDILRATTLADAYTIAEEALK